MRRRAPRAASRARAGRNLLDGEELPPKARGSLAPGQRLRIETPGGGGHGRMSLLGFIGLGIMGSRQAANLRAPATS